MNLTSKNKSWIAAGAKNRALAKTRNKGSYCVVHVVHGGWIAAPQKAAARKDECVRLCDKQGAAEALRGVRSAENHQERAV